ncbi:MAG: hypothetical protein ACK5GJ_02730 [Planctomycetota bacterium]
MATAPMVQTEPKNGKPNVDPQDPFCGSSHGDGLGNRGAHGVFSDETGFEANDVYYGMPWKMFKTFSKFAPGSLICWRAAVF